MNPGKMGSIKPRLHKIGEKIGRYNYGFFLVMREDKGIFYRKYTTYWAVFSS